MQVVLSFLTRILAMEEIIIKSSIRGFSCVGMYLDLMSQPTLSQAQESTPVLCSSNCATELRPSPGLTPLRSEAPDLAASSRQKGWSGLNDF